MIKKNKLTSLSNNKKEKRLFFYLLAIMIFFFLLLEITILIAGSYYFNKKKTCATCSACAVGDTGPGGGKVFYIASGVCYEAPTSDQSTVIRKYKWGCYGTEISGADGTAIGTGYQNTQAILAGCEERPIASSVCSSLTLGGKSDWFLPSKDELNQMYIQRSVIGGFSSNDYWSSSQFSSNNAWLQYFGNGLQYGYIKDYSGQVRCSRSF